MVTKPTIAYKYIKLSHKYNISPTYFGHCVDILSENVMHIFVMHFPEYDHKNDRNMLICMLYFYTCMCIGWFR